MNRNINILSAIVLFIFMAICAPTVSAAPDGFATEISDDAVIEPQIKVAGAQVEIEISDDDSHQVTIYALTGQIVKNVTAEHGHTAVELPRGYYIVKVDRVAKRVIIK